MNERASDTARVGIFGGSFNPPHVAHLVVAEVVREAVGLDRVLWIPNRQSPFKDEEDLAPADDRLEMTRLAIGESDAFTVSDLEVRRGGVSYTVDSILALQAQNPDESYFLIIGSDSLADFDDWKEPEEILRRVRLVIYPRPGHREARPPTGFEERVTTVDAPLLEISSSLIRARRKAGQTIRYMVPEPVHRYILRRGLYVK